MIRRYSAAGCTVLALFLGLWAVAFPAADAVWAGPATTMRGPGAAGTPHPPLGGAPRARAPRYDHAHSVGTDLFLGLLSFYRTVVSAVDGDRCSMAPTCSLYAHQALREHGVLVGVLLTADRLIHEADEPARGTRIEIGGETYFLDPLEANTYWLSD